MKRAEALIAWVGVAVLFLLLTFGWRVAAGVAFMAAAAGLADYLWSKITGKTVSAWFWRKRNLWIDIVIFVVFLGAGLVMHLMGL